MGNVFFVEEISSCKKILRYALKSNDEVDNIEYNVLIDNDINWLIVPCYVGADRKRWLEYDVYGKMSLADYMLKGIKIDELIIILKELKNIVYEIDDLMLSMNHIVFNPKYIFTDDLTNIEFIILPILSQNNNGMIEFLTNIIDKLELNDENGVAYISEMKEILNLKNETMIEDLIYTAESMKKFREGKLLNKNNEVNNNGFDFLIPKSDMNIELKDNLSSDAHNMSEKLGRSEKLEKLEKSKKSKILNAEKESKPKRYSIFDALKMKFKPQILVKEISDLSDLELDKENNSINFYENIDEKADERFNKADKINKTDKIDIQLPKYDYENTVLIRENRKNDNTFILYALKSGLYPIRPFLIRRVNGEKIHIDKDEFKIGKDKNIVDYAVEDNFAVSRVHAEIFRINSNYYIKDHNSKNFTYLNDNKVESSTPLKLSHNDVICLSNEIFIFKLY